MSYEVELKAHVDDPITLMHDIEQHTGIVDACCEEKDDIYYALLGDEPLFRLRMERFGPSFHELSGNVRFTRKYKNLKGGIEVNEEVEFLTSSDQAEQAHAFFLSLGYQVYIRKTKRGYSYEWKVDETLSALHIELVEIASLGWFLEMEFVLEAEEQVPYARTRLLEVLSLLGVPQERIEERYYMHLLKELS
ncbi:CYTH domain-containing protein [Sphaerochaeta halotolerans]|jgi:adenylate cyclase class 2|uniref:CYTH domain-containing protein n=1 Tax=Sphaerochaeta halotolerans TaxID=2293840 RepID=A0A372MGE6_9SPIR|nr:CYTH domain-containing protein [Sphaerochaeta halotolerans]MXI85852.1 CYTH domain-containing protein [Sphaerochaeta halotolerans]RFU94366.1 CYTH domain-containing protein [Sphaerochaeta halotolerans]